jgi:murein DD-endopeptidase MepM/ murein hydrolase activator NlpD
MQGPKDKKNIARRVGDFLAGRGFYVVLFACTAIIGVSAWALLFTGNGALSRNRPAENIDTAVTTPVLYLTPDPNGLPAFAQSKPSPSQTPSPTPTAEPSPSPTPTPAPKEEHEGTAAPKTIKDVKFMWPLSGDVTAEYSVDALVYSRTMGDWRVHPALDIAGAIGAKVSAAADGTVIDVQQDDLLGTIVEIDHGFGVISRYCNLAGKPVVKKGDKVSAGAVIGAVGDTALGETGDVTHLHFEMKRDGEFVNPQDYLPKK